MPNTLFPVRTFLSDLPSHLTPQLGPGSPARRLVIVGDVHGMRRSLQALLQKVGFDQAKGDHLVFVGDLVNKGPDSPGVIDLAVELGASAVRGNHDNAVLDAAMEISAVEDHHRLTGHLASCPAQRPDGSGADQSSEVVASEGREKNPSPEPSVLTRHSATTYSTARALSKRQLDWLAALPLILRIKLPHHPSSSLDDTLVVVHAGLVPGIPLEQQDPQAVMLMRSLVQAPSDDDGQFTPAEASGEEGWVAQWDQWQDQQAARTTVVFGHDAKRRLQRGRHAIGLDSACLYGYHLSALVIEPTDRGIQHQVVQIECVDTPIVPTTQAVALPPSENPT
ncbi:Metallo-dependent phosphatase-like protein [Aspergillus bertholletiae]|uniref:Metallo-dependent phosphatase-like protein n=1 Tax=Aspergillus bertholletiae TaxID=1226010 RepID=A0A5N7AYC5_9EURO|nr:Metallo-dependent phosphatase-like protein [Aspergillus bertholletiae]